MTKIQQRLQSQRKRRTQDPMSPVDSVSRKRRRFFLIDQINIFSFTSIERWENDGETSVRFSFLGWRKMITCYTFISLVNQQKFESSDLSLFAREEQENARWFDTRTWTLTSLGLSRFIFPEKNSTIEFFQRLETSPAGRIETRKKSDIGVFCLLGGIQDVQHSELSREGKEEERRKWRSSW